MKEVIAIVLSCMLLMTACSANSVVSEVTTALSDPSEETTITSESIVSVSTETSIQEVTSKKTEEMYSSETSNAIVESTISEISDTNQNDVIMDIDTKSEGYIKSLGFTSLDDDRFLQYIEDSVYADLEVALATDDYYIEEVSTIYLSKDYLETLAYNSQENIYFGYTLSELDEVFQGQKYIFTLGEDGQTDVIPFEEYRDNTFNQVVKNVAIGAGVILICVTVSTLTAGLGAPAVSMVFAASAKTATTFALSSGVIGGVSAGVIEGFKTHDFEKAKKAAAIGASESFKWGAISGALVGGVSEGAKLYNSAKNVSNAIPTHDGQLIGRAGEEYATQFYKGEEQVSFLAGEKVPQGTPGATRPDIWYKTSNGAFEAIEVKNYDLVNNLGGLKKELNRQISSRMVNLPEGTAQRIVLVTKGRGYKKEFVDSIVKELQTYLFDVYGGTIPIDVI